MNNRIKSENAGRKRLGIFEALPWRNQLVPESWRIANICERSWRNLKDPSEWRQKKRETISPKKKTNRKRWNEATRGYPITTARNVGIVSGGSWVAAPGRHYALPGAMNQRRPAQQSASHPLRERLAPFDSVNLPVDAWPKPLDNIQPTRSTQRSRRLSKNLSWESLPPTPPHPTRC